MQVLELIIKRIAALEDAYHESIRGMERIEDRMAFLESQDSKLIEAVAPPSEEMLGRLSSLEARLDGIRRVDESLSSLMSRVDSLVAKSEDSQRRLDAHDLRWETSSSSVTNVAGLTDRVINLEAKQETILEAAAAPFARLVDRMEVLEERVGAIEGLITEFRSFTDHVIAHEAQLAGVETALTAQASKVEALDEQVAGYQAHFEIADKHLNSYRAELNGLDERVRAATDQLNSYDEQIALASGRSNAQADQLQAMSERIGGQEELLQRVRTDQEVLAQMVESSAGDAAAQLAPWTEKLAALEASVAARIEEVAGRFDALGALKETDDEHARELMILAERLAGLYERDAEQAGPRRQLAESVERLEPRLEALENRNREILESVSVTQAARMLDRVEVAEERLVHLEAASDRVGAVMKRLERVEEMAAEIPSFAETLSALSARTGPAARSGEAPMEIAGDVEDRLVQLTTQVSTLRSKFEMLDSIRSVLAASDVDSVLEEIQSRIARLDAQVSTLFTLNRVMPQDGEQKVVHLQED